MPDWDLLIEYPLFHSSEGISLLKFVLSYLCVNQVELCCLQCQFSWLLVNKKNVLAECAFGFKDLSALKIVNLVPTRKLE